MPVLGVPHVSINVDEVDTAIAFYVEQLRLTRLGSSRRLLRR